MNLCRTWLEATCELLENFGSNGKLILNKLNALTQGLDMHLLMTLLLAHLFADFPLQTNALAKLKDKHFEGVFYHVLIHMAITALLIRDSQQYWLLIVGLGIVHFVIDALKILLPFKKGVWYFLADQFVHLISLVLATYLAQRLWYPAPVGILPDKWLVMVLSGALVPAVMVLFWVWTSTLNPEYVTRSLLLCWTKQRLLLIEQRVGLALISVVFARPAFYWVYSLADMVRVIWK